ncbi:MAG: DNA-binding protein [Sandaracinaceae bacterium]|nr:DNA-binding protein [Sandaracinaceae bacterium]
MRAVSSERQRRFLVRLRGGEDAVEALEALAQRERMQAAWVRGVGALERAELEHAVVDEPCEILSLSGSISWDGDEPRPRLRAALAPLSDGSRIVGGVLTVAPSTDVELLVECFDDVPLELVEAAPKPPRIRASAPPSRALVEPPEDVYDDEDEDDDDEPAPARSAGPVSWADVAAASADVEAPEPEWRAPAPAPARGPARAAPRVEHRGPSPEKGDFVSHMQFGLCKVEKVDGRGGIIVKLASGLRKKIRLDFMDVGRPRREDGRKVFPVRAKKR